MKKIKNRTTGQIVVLVSVFFIIFFLFLSQQPVDFNVIFFGILTLMGYLIMIGKKWPISAAIVILFIYLLFELFAIVLSFNADMSLKVPARFFTLRIFWLVFYMCLIGLLFRTDVQQYAK